jgi:hypothetical protein
MAMELIIIEFVSLAPKIVHNVSFISQKYNVVYVNLDIIHRIRFGVKSVLARALIASK